MNGDSLELDHLGMLTRDLAVAAHAMQRLGFCMAPPSHHCEQLSVGTREKTGTANQCIMFRRGYIEVLSIVDHARYSGWISGALNRYEGLHVIGFGHDDLRGLIANLTARGQTPLVRRLTRSVEIAGEERSASFTILFHNDTEFPEGRFVTMQHHTRDVLWHPSLLDHPNSALALAGVTLVCDDPGEFLGRVTAWTGSASARRVGRALHVDLPGAVIEAMTTRDARDIYGSALPSSSPPIVGMTVAVASLPTTARYLAQQDVAHRRTDSGLLIGAPDACGAFIHFIENERFNTF